MTSLRIILIFGLVTVRAAVGRFRNHVPFPTSWTAFEHTCSNDQSLSLFKSRYESGFAADRLFEIRCTDLPEPTALEECQWSDWVNDFGGSFSVSWQGKIITGIKSEFNPNYLPPDRRFKFRHCFAKGKILISPFRDDSVKDRINVDWEFEIPEDRVLTGIESSYEASLKDRSFVFMDSEMSDPRTPL